MAIQKATPVKLVYIKALPIQAAPETLHIYRQLQYQNLITALEAFTTDNGFYIVLEYMPLFLKQIIRLLAYLDKRQIAAILGQVSFYNLFKNIY